MAIKHSEEADLGPLNGQMLLAFRLQYIENDRDAILIVVSDDALIRIGSITLDDATLLLRSFRRLMVLQEECLWIENGRVLSKQQCLHFDELDVTIL